jgi:isopentenyl-diphosphate delta-isomerase
MILSTTISPRDVVAAVAPVISVSMVDLADTSTWRKVFKGPIIASGGIRNGLDVAKSLVLGADLAGFAIPALQAQNAGGSDAVKKRLETVVQEIRIACYLLGCKNLKGLKKQKPILTGKTRDWVEQALGKR